jgi:hypothetical membrane protein
MPRKTLLVCGVVSSFLYVAIDVLAAVVYGGYHSFTSQAISELGAIGAPTKHLVDPLFLVYDLLLIAFAVGVWQAAGGKRALQLIGVFLAGIGVVGLPAPWFYAMHLRGTTGVASDVPHIVATGLIVALILAAMIAGAFAFGRRFRAFSLVSLIIVIATGFLTSVEARGLATGGPVRWLGLAERVNIGMYLAWVAALAFTLLHAEESPAARSSPSGRLRPAVAP